MESGATGWTLRDLAQALGGTFEGPADLRLERPVPSTSGDSAGVTFAESEAYIAVAEKSGVGAVIVGEAAACSKPCIRVASPRQAFGRLLALVDRPLIHSAGVHPTAVIDPDAVVHPGAVVGPYAVVERHASIGAGARVYAFCYVGERCVVGANASIHPHAVLVRDVQLGEGAIVHPGAVLGADGFGYVFDGERQQKVPQVGGVSIGPHAEIGANTTVDRATAGSTLVGAGTKIDNLVQVAHNTSMGDHCVIAAQVGIGGSSTIGDRVTMGGQAALSDHVAVGSDVVLAGRTGVTNDIQVPGTYWGLPAKPIREAMRILGAAGKMPELWARLRKLERKTGDDEERL